MSVANANAIQLPSHFGNVKHLTILKKIAWKKLAVYTKDEIKFIPFEDISYCLASNNYATIFTRNGSSYLCAKTLKEIESKLPSDLFIRIHHSYLVNIQFITSLKRHSNELEIDNKIILPISRSRKNELYELFNV
jgi:two-component system LytT family response regulator